MSKARERKARSGTEKIDPKPFNDLVAHARLKSIRLVDASFVVKPGALSEDRDAWAYTADDELTDWQLDCEKLLLRGRYSYRALCIEGRRRPVSLKASYLATFRLSRDCEENAALAYLQRVGRFSCYPYFRALFATMTDQSGLHLPPLPVIAEQPRLVRGPT